MTGKQVLPFMTTAVTLIVMVIALFLVNSRPVEAEGLGSQIVCVVFSDLNQVGTPLPFLETDGCPDESEPVPACEDGIDNDNDGHTDYPSDPGCENTVDTTESPDPIIEPPVLPGACLDGIDNDNDGLTDWTLVSTDGGDPGCTSPLDEDESNDPPPPPPPPDPVLPTLTVFKVVINDHSGTGVVVDFPLSIGNVAESTNTPVVSGATTTLSAGAFIVSELSNANYTATFSGDCDATGNITLAAGDVKTCTITNDDVAPPPTEGGGGNPGDNPPVSSGGGGGGGFYPSGQVLGTTTIAVEPRVCDPYLKTFIKLGRANDREDVGRLQSFLNEFDGATIEVTNEYNQETFTAVKAFQAKHLGEILSPWGIDAPTGYVYLTTRKKINEIHCDSSFPLTATEQDEIARIRGLAQSDIRPKAPKSISPVVTTTLPPETAEVVPEPVPTKKSVVRRAVDFFSRLIGRERD